MGVKGFTIDDASSRDLDDSIWVEHDSRGFVVTVCIANVCDAIAKESVFDNTAKRRVEALYHRSGNTPMIPRRFSEGSCSLLEGEDRAVMAIRIRVDHEMKAQGLPIIWRDKLNSHKRFSYSDIPKVLEDKDHVLNKNLDLSRKLSLMLMEDRRRNGAFAGCNLELGWIMTEIGSIRKIYNAKETIGHVIIQEIMILANREIARFCIEKDIPVPFRNHTAKSSAPNRHRMNKIIEDAVPEDFERLSNSITVVMNKAEYGASSEGHYGLNLAAYIHATSPIRRFADLVVQRQVLGFINGRNLAYDKAEIEEICDHINKKIEENSEKRSWEEISKANNKADRSISKGKLSHLSEKEFERVVKVSVRRSFNPSVSREFINRLEADNAPTVAIYQILIESDDEWIEAKRAALSYLVKNLYIASNVLNIANCNKAWTKPRFLCRRVGADNEVMNIASVSFEHPKISTRDLQSRSLKKAKQMAIVEAFCISVKEPLPEWSALKKVVDDKCLRLDSKNPIGDLVMYCQKSELSLPDFQSERVGGSDHNPTFSASCSVAGVSVKSEPVSSKRLAKKYAAIKAIQLILEKT